ncbi:hypothetical protein L6164_000549 [Bauhinia variegata]|uniref:Uncharacterized protein n=1 Tax=Bauhinia variegata TaxID=167791 RepID=A0ACB9Q6A2_BAUVA|nr:hypothetical protein L6164_000549 [Bauhinia variegata]
MKMLVCWVVLCTIIWVLQQARNTYPTEEARAHAYSKIIEIFLIKSLMFIVFNSSCCYAFISAPNEYYDPQIRCKGHGPFEGISPAVGLGILLFIRCSPCLEICFGFSCFLFA